MDNPQILKALEGCFDPGEIETLAYRFDDQAGAKTMPVKVIHKPSGREFIGDSKTQVESKISALVQLLADDFPAPNVA